MCTHQPPCPPAGAVDEVAARTVCNQVGQGWSLLCNGVIVFDDTGELCPDPQHPGQVIAVGPRRGPALHAWGGPL